MGNQSCICNCNKKEDISLKQSTVEFKKILSNFKISPIHYDANDNSNSTGAWVSAIDEKHMKDLIYTQIMCVDGKDTKNLHFSEIYEMLQNFEPSDIHPLKITFTVKKLNIPSLENVQIPQETVWDAVYDHNYAVTFNPDTNKNLMHTIKEDYREDNNSEEEDGEDGWEDDFENEKKQKKHVSTKKKGIKKKKNAIKEQWEDYRWKNDSEEEFEDGKDGWEDDSENENKEKKGVNKTYVHDTLSANIRPWFQAHEIEDNSYSVPVNEAYLSSTAESYQGTFMVPMIMVGGLFVGKYLYKKFFKKLSVKKFSME